MPMRITDDLVNMLKKYHPIWLNTHFNHPKELTPTAAEALRKLADAGIPLGNQSVLLRGVNDCKHIMRELVQLLCKNRVRPYYIYICDLSHGYRTLQNSGFQGYRNHRRFKRTYLRYAVPTFVVDAPGGGGKTPVMPRYVISQTPHKVILRNYEGIITTYTEPSLPDLPAPATTAQARRPTSTKAFPLWVKVLRSRRSSLHILQDTKETNTKIQCSSIGRPLSPLWVC